MLKLFVAVLALMAVASAFPSDVERNLRPVPPNGVPQQAGPSAVSEEANKEGLEGAETFGYGYYNHYPRYYYGGYGGYGGYGYGFYPRYYHSYPQYYW